MRIVGIDDRFWTTRDALGPQRQTAMKQFGGLHGYGYNKTGLVQDYWSCSELQDWEIKSNTGTERRRSWSVASFTPIYNLLAFIWSRRSFFFRAVPAPC